MTTNEWDEYAADWDNNADVRDYSEKAFSFWEDKVAPAISNLSNCRALDFGCGTGLLAEKLAGQCGEVVAIDSSPKMVQVLRAKIDQLSASNIVASDVTVNADTIRTHPLFSRKFDLVVASSVCSFLPDYESTLRDLSRLMKSGAWFVQWDWATAMPEARIKDAFRASGLVEQCVTQAFSMESSRGAESVVMGIARLHPTAQPGD